MLYSFRKAMRKILFFIAGKINFSFISPNILTLLSIPFALVAAYYIFLENFSFAVVFMVVAFFIDALDGPLAEIRKQKTLFGNYLDAMVDRAVEAIIFFGFAFQYPFASAFAFATAFFASHSKAMLGLFAETDNRDWPSMGDRPDRVAVLFFGMILSVFMPVFNSYSTMEIVLFLLALLGLAGFIQRILFAKKYLERGKDDSFQ